MRALLFACALFCLLTVIGMPAAAFQRLGILPPGEDDCLMGSIVIELGSISNSTNRCIKCFSTRNRNEKCL